MIAFLHARSRLSILAQILISGARRLIEIETHTLGGVYWVKGLTWRGHEFLERGQNKNQEMVRLNRPICPQKTALPARVLELGYSVRSAGVGTRLTPGDTPESIFQKYRHHRNFAGDVIIRARMKSSASRAAASALRRNRARRPGSQRGPRRKYKFAKRGGCQAVEAHTPAA